MLHKYGVGAYHMDCQMLLQSAEVEFGIHKLLQEKHLVLVKVAAG